MVSAIEGLHCTASDQKTGRWEGQGTRLRCGHNLLAECVRMDTSGWSLPGRYLVGTDVHQEIICKLILPVLDKKAGRWYIA